MEDKGLTNKPNPHKQIWIFIPAVGSFSALVAYFLWVLRAGLTSDWWVALYQALESAFGFSPCHAHEV